MAIVTIDKNKIKQIIGKAKINDEKIDHLLSMFSTPVEKMSKNEIEVEVAPNRPDMLSAQGIYRALSAYIGKKRKTGLKQYKTNKPAKNYEVIVSDSLKNIRPHTACAIIKDINFNDEKIKEVIDIQEKLHATVGRNRKKIAIGIYPLEKIKLPIKFQAKEPNKIKFIPLEMNREMNGFQILQRHPTGQKYAHLLKGKAKFPIFTDSKGKILSMPPIINSQDTGKINEKTKDIFIECSGFDFQILSKALNILVTMFADMGGKIYEMKIKHKRKTLKTPNLKPEKIKINLDYANKVLGLNLKEKDVKKNLERMGYLYSKGNVLIPAWRTDILHEIDIVEDIAIAYGYDKFQPEILEISTIGEENKKQEIKRKISSILIGLGMQEIISSILTNKEYQLKKMNLKEKKEEVIEIQNSKTEYDILRKNLIPIALKILSENTDAEYPQKIFEIGKVFEKNNKGNLETNITEKEKLIVSLAPGNFTDIKQVLEYLGQMIGIEFKLVPSIINGFIEGRAGEILLDGKKIGGIGEIHPAILKNWHIKMPVAILEISLEEIFKKFLQK